MLLDCQELQRNRVPVVVAYFARTKAGEAASSPGNLVVEGKLCQLRLGLYFSRGDALPPGWPYVVAYSIARHRDRDIDVHILKPFSERERSLNTLNGPEC